MTAATWRIESRPTVHSTWVPLPGYSELLHGDALVMGEWMADHYPLGQLRLQDVSTGEVIHLGSDGKPLGVAA